MAISISISNHDLTIYSSSGEESSEKQVSESESDSDPSSPPPAVKAKRPALVPKTDTHESKAKKAKKKKKSGEDDTEAKTPNVVDEPKKTLFQRFWIGEDEVVILQGVSDYNAKMKAVPTSEMVSFYDFIKKSLHVGEDVIKSQVDDKVRKMKKKFVNKFKKEEHGKETNFSKPRDQLCYNLAKKIWASETAKTYQVRKNGSVVIPSEVDEADVHKEEVIAMEVDSDVQSIGQVLSGCHCDSVDQMIKKGWKLVAGSKKNEWERKSKKLMEEEFELYGKRLELKNEQVKLVSEAMKSAKE